MGCRVLVLAVFNVEYTYSYGRHSEAGLGGDGVCDGSLTRILASKVMG